MVTIEEVSYGQWGNCVRLSNGNIELFVTVEFGPRIIKFGYIGKSNMMFEDKDVKVFSKGPDFDEKFGEGSVWYIRGGHRLWTSPEISPRTYYPDNDPVLYEKTENGVILTPPEQKWNNIQMQIKISMCPDSDNVTVDHYVTNTGAWNSEFAAWAITVLAPGGTEIVPQPTFDTGLLPNRTLAIWPYTRMTDERIFWGDRYIVLKQLSSADRPLKIGINSEHGFAAYILDGDMFIKRFDVIKNGNYPDGGMSFETYTSELIMEMETLSEVKTLAPGETIVHTEKWELVRDVVGNTDTENDIDEIVNKYIV